MTPAARVQAAIEVLSALEQTPAPADRVLRDFFRARRYAGSKDRAAVADRVFDCYRHYYSYGWRMGGHDPRRLAIASVLAEGRDPAEIFSGVNYAPAALGDDERGVIGAPLREAPLHVLGEFPDWLKSEFVAAFGDDLLPEMTAMQTRAPVDLRVNTLKTSREKLTAALAAEGFEAAPTPYAANGLRLDGTATAKLSASPLFAAGHFEFQDEAAQIASALCEAEPGMRVLDYAAGAGGKSLALAAAMRNNGIIVAHDIDPGRLAMIGPRAERAGISIIHTGTDLPPAAFNLVLLDAPCSGTGTWRRQPELRARLSAERLTERVKLQAKLLAKASSFVAVGGKLVYATCSVLPCENDGQIIAFLANHPNFSAVAVSDAHPFFHASPYRTQTDGFFTAVLQRRF
jgi:16S rRNA (cytosine967-C5)-methyltransferase